MISGERWCWLALPERAEPLGGSVDRAFCCRLGWRCCRDILRLRRRGKNLHCGYQMKFQHNKIMLKLFSFALLLLPSVPTFAKTNQANPPSSVIRFKPSFPTSGLTKVDGDNLLIWNRSGQAQNCDQHRNWSPAFRFPSQDLMLNSNNNSAGISNRMSDLIPDKLGILILYNNERSNVFFLTGMGDKILDHWQANSNGYNLISNGSISIHFILASPKEKLVFHLNQ